MLDCDGGLLLERFAGGRRVRIIAPQHHRLHETNRSMDSTASPAALQGVRVIEMGQLIAGPFCGKTLGEFGADVIKIEAPESGDPLRNWRLIKEGTSVWWQVQSRNKRSVALDLRQKEGQDIARQLIAEADVRVIIEELADRLHNHSLGLIVITAIQHGNSAVAIGFQLTRCIGNILINERHGHVLDSRKLIGSVLSPCKQQQLFTRNAHIQHLLLQRNRV